MRTAFPRGPIAGKCDASGAGTITIRGPAHFWVAAYVAIQVDAGTPSYTVQVGSALPLIFGGGQQSQLGPFLIWPGEAITIVIKGAGANANVTGQLIGWQSDVGPEELPDVLPPPTQVIISGQVTATITGTPTVAFQAGASVIVSSITAGSITFTNSQINVQNVPANLLNTNSPQTTLAAASSFNGGATTTKTFTVPAGTHAVGVGWRTSGSLQRLQVIGAVTGTPYYDATFWGPPSQGWQVIDIDSVIDTSISFTITTFLGGPFLFDFVAILDTEAIKVRGNPGEGLQVRALNPTDTLVRFAASMASGVLSHIIPDPPAPNVVRVLWGWLRLDAISGAGSPVVTLQDTLGNVLWDFSAGTLDNPALTLPLDGYVVPGNRGIDAEQFTGAALTVRLTLIYNAHPTIN